MMQKLKTRLNPMTIVVIWAMLMIMLTPILMFVSNIGASGGEQKPLTTLATMIAVTIYGSALFSIVTPFIYRQWFRQNLWFSFIILLTLTPVAKLIYDDISRSPYISSEQLTRVGNDEISVKTEFYDDFKTIRSISYWKNEKRDSVWKVFSKDGQIIKQQTFRNDTLIDK